MASSLAIICATVGGLFGIFELLNYGKPMTCKPIILVTSTTVGSAFSVRGGVGKG